jgi:O-antigen/teichoic acid export membrane protein
MGYAYGIRDSSLVRKLHRRSFQVNLWGSLITILGLIIFGNLILSQWTGGKVKMDFTLFFLFIAASAINVLWASSLMVSYATNRHMQIAKAFILINSTGLVMAYTSGPKFGLLGIGIIIFCIELFMISFVIQRSIEMTEDSWLKFICMVTRPPVFLFGLFKK